MTREPMLIDARPFGGDADGNNSLFSINAGGGATKRDALLHATCAVNCVVTRLSKAIGDGQVDIGEAWMMREVLEAAQALLEACE